jgi:hypothetical protein
MIKRRFFTIALAICANFVYAQFNYSRIEATDLPTQLKYAGKLQKAVKWVTDNNEHYVILSQKEIYQSTKKDMDGYFTKNAELFAYHYTISKDSSHQVWRVYDYTFDCGFDILQSFIGEKVHLTDLNKNGEPEIWVLYRNQCTSDVSPATTKLIMYENNTKYAVRGVDKVKNSALGYEGGEYGMDKNFKSANILFQQYAIDLWNKYCIRN